MWVGLGTAGDDAVEPELYADRMVNPGVPMSNSEAASQFHISVTDHDGERHRASFDLQSTPDEAPSVWRAEIPEPPGLSRGASWGIGLFIIFTALPVFLWIALVR